MMDTYFLHFFTSTMYLSLGYVLKLFYIYIYVCVCVCIYIYIYSWFGLQGKTCTMKQKYNNIQKKIRFLEFQNACNK